MKAVRPASRFSGRRSIWGDQIAGGDILALLRAQFVVRHRHEPDVDVEPMAGVSERQRPAARLRHVADQDAVPAGGLAARSARGLDQFGMAPVAVARQPHDLPIRSHRPAARRRLPHGNSRSPSWPRLGSFFCENSNLAGSLLPPARVPGGDEHRPALASAQGYRRRRRTMRVTGRRGRNGRS